MQFQPCWWPAMRLSAGEKRRTKRPTMRPCWKRWRAWPTLQRPCDKAVTGSPRRCWIGIISASTAPTQRMDRRDDAPSGLRGFNTTGAPELDRHPGDRHLLRDRGLHRLLSPGILQYQRRVLYGRAGDDRVDCRLELCFCQPGLARVDGLGWVYLPVWNPGHALVLDRGYSGNALPRHCHDAVLLHLEDPLRTGISKASLRRWGTSPLRHQLRVHDHSHERHQYVLDGYCDEGGPGLGPELQHLGFIGHGGRVRCPGGAEIGDL